MSTHREPCTHGYLLWFDGEGGYWHDMHHTQQCDDPDASTKRFGAEPEQPIPPAYSLEELEHAIEFAKAIVVPPHFGGPLNNALRSKLEAAARLLREQHKAAEIVAWIKKHVNFIEATGAGWTVRAACNLFHNSVTSHGGTFEEAITNAMKASEEGEGEPALEKLERGATLSESEVEMDWILPLKIVRGHEGFQLEDAKSRMICDGMTSRDAATLLHILSEYFKVNPQQRTNRDRG